MWIICNWTFLCKWFKKYMYVVTIIILSYYKEIIIIIINLFKFTFYWKQIDDIVEIVRNNGSTIKSFKNHNELRQSYDYCIIRIFALLEQKNFTPFFWDWRITITLNCSLSSGIYETKYFKVFFIFWRIQYPTG